MWKRGWKSRPSGLYEDINTAWKGRDMPSFPVFAHKTAVTQLLMALWDAELQPLPALSVHFRFRRTSVSAIQGRQRELETSVFDMNQITESQSTCSVIVEF